jgi:hypothetical protein
MNWKISVLLLFFPLCVLAEEPAKTYNYIFEQEMPLEDCLTEMSGFAQRQELILEMFAPAEFYLRDQAHKQVGNAYYENGSCYIYYE